MYYRKVTFYIPANAGPASIASLARSGMKATKIVSFDQRKNLIYRRDVEYPSGDFNRIVFEHPSTNFVLIGGPEEFSIPASLPPLPKKPQVIGFTFSDCAPGRYALLLPTTLNYSLLTKQGFQRFTQFASSTLYNKYSANEAFRLFCDFHSLHLLMPPCNRSAAVIGKWEDIPVIEYENPNPPKAWSEPNLIPEVWKIANEL